MPDSCVIYSINDIVVLNGVESFAPAWVSINGSPEYNIPDSLNVCKAIELVFQYSVSDEKLNPDASFAIGLGSVIIDNVKYALGTYHFKAVPKDG